MKKIIISILLIFITLFAFCVSTFATGNQPLANIVLTKDKSLSKDGYIVLNLSLNNTSVDAGFNAFLGKLDYDETQLELIRVEGKNGFNSTSGGKILLDNINLVSSNTILAVITLKEKTNNVTTRIGFKDVQISNNTNTYYIPDFELNSGVISVLSHLQNVQPLYLIIACIIFILLIIVITITIVKRLKKKQV